MSPRPLFFCDRGIARHLLDAAPVAVPPLRLGTRRLLGRRWSQAAGAEILEAYPVDPDSPSYRFMGFVSLYEEAGFHEVGRVGKRRHVMRLDL